MLLREIPPSDRPREKLFERGAAALSDAELLAILLRTGRKGKSAVALARELLDWKKGSLAELRRASPSELCAAVPGIGPAKAAQFCAAIELAHRLARRQAERPLLDNASAVYDVFAPELQSQRAEVVKIVLVDTRLRLLREETVSRGTLDQSAAHPREIFRPAIIHNAYGVILLHNHPSGDPAPSRADHALTRRLAEAAQLLQISFLDHLIIGTPEGGRTPYFSFRESGCL